MAEKSSEDVKGKSVCHQEDSDSDQGHKEDVVGLSLEKLNLGPKKKLLILCLGGLLCHRLCRKRGAIIPRNRTPDTSYGSFLVYKRPYCDEFVKFCFERFEVGIWSSAREWYLDNALDCVLKGHRSKLLFAWDQEECTDSGFKTLENRNKPIFLKELKKLFSSNRLKGKYSSSNTLLIDNDPYKALLNPPHTAIFPSEYKLENANYDSALGPKGELRLYLDGLAEAEDVPSYVKNKPFGKPAIDPDHPNWDYYSKIIDSQAKN
ncbi:hypothetical protein Tsubulata_026354 [Turnera subulata]|uniref:Mitochondrial import inner membrane translocase subunit TIM50 n=1 Tax=Turnera subulata TaxID=218843 RepID=A0A9Q0FJY4_9ROSI|nr:hypothetical protein Tsubulata_026354 [Turnera subulata]